MLPRRRVDGTASVRSGPVLTAVEGRISAGASTTVPKRATKTPTTARRRGRQRRRRDGLCLPTCQRSGMSEAVRRGRRPRNDNALVLRGGDFLRLADLDRPDGSDQALPPTWLRCRGLHIGRG